jgi:hypothetical protein
MEYFDPKTNYYPGDHYKAFLNLILETWGVDTGKKLVTALLDYCSDPSIFLSLAIEDIPKVTSLMTTRSFLRNI